MLLIDDAEPQRYLIEGYLAHSKVFEADVMWAGSLVEAIRLLRFNTFDVCLLDYDLGYHTALDVMAHFRLQHIELPVIVMTGYGSHDIDLAVMGAGALDYLDKASLNAALLERSIRYTLQGARAQKQAQDLAAYEERQRLARELHDVVSQTLFSASVIADSLTRIGEDDPARLRLELERLAKLNRSALAEMRALLVELRPQAILSIPLPELVNNLISGLRGRSGVTVTLEIVGEPVALTADVQLQFYRVIQELLTNTYKHAHASEIRVGLHYLEDSLELVVADDGVGFNLDKIPPDHHGLQIIRERMNKIGANLYIESAMGEGTYTQVSWPLPVA